MKNSLWLFVLLMLACTSKKEALVEYVNPFIGTGGHGHTYPGATMPFGMVQLSPDTRLEGWDGCGGYHDDDSLIYGFSHTHLQGTGISDYGDILIMPTNNNVHKGNNWGERYRSAFKKTSEKAHAGYYSVHLDDHHVTAELTATTRVGIHKYTFDEADSCVVFMDMAHRDELLGYQFDPVGDTMIVGMRQSKEWAQNQTVYFAAVYDHAFEYLDQTYEIAYETDSVTGESIQVMEMVPVFPLKFGKIDQLQLKVGLSSTSIEAAIENLKTEAPHWDFNRYKTDAENAWEKELGKIKVSSDDRDEKTKFYTALYHSLTVPNTWSDVDGSYRGTDFQIHNGNNTQYTVFSLWDTFRATHPLYTIIERERTEGFIQSFLNMYQQGGKLPMWELAANYTGCMIGYHAVPVIVDAHFKGIGNFDKNLALEAMVSTANTDELGKTAYASLGYIPMEAEHESVSKTLEYAYNDWCIARFAEDIGNDSIAQIFYCRALSYRNLFDPKSGFIRPKRGASFTENFDPTEVNFNYTEANGWQYNFFVPQDIEGHIALLGGSEKYAEKLDQLFFGSSEMGGREQPDITGLIGQYAHGNEPSHHMAYLYNYVGQPHKTQLLIDSIMGHLYFNAPDGLSGNEDCGQMSSWYVLSALGFYSVTPGTDEWVLGLPRFEKAEINLENGKMFTVVAENFNPKNKYVQSVSLNGKPHVSGFIQQADILAGGVLTFKMGNKPNDGWLENPPNSSIADRLFLAAPTIEIPRTFRDSVYFSISHIDAANTKLFWRIAEPFGMVHDLVPFIEYTGQTTISTDGVLEAYATRGDLKSAVVGTAFRRVEHDYVLSISADFDNQYTAGGDQALIDGIVGGNNFRTGDWQGYYGTDVSFTVDLGTTKTISAVHLGTLQEVGPWIWMPEVVTFEASLDGINFIEIGRMYSPMTVEDERAMHGPFSCYETTRCRYIRLNARNRGLVPDWHPGAGYPSWMFFDEIEIVTP
ncbi:MAG: glycoside hydrolase family 92 protein [Cryomorphaceae bacterium]|nr:glycoside hydrolase family 92 protein [Cryomorphaceae bacterium]